MTDDKDNSINRRHFIVSASTIALAGCTSLGGSDLPPPNYDENPREEEQDNSNGDKDDQDDPDEELPEDQQPVELSGDEKRFIEMYRSAYVYTDQGMEFVGSAISELRDRRFDEAEKSILDAQLQLWDARDIVVRKEEGQEDGSTTRVETELWELAGQLDENTDLNLESILSDFETAITMALAAASLAREANTARDDGQVEKYRKQRGEAQIKLNNSEFYMPMDSNELRGTYIGDL